ncbi:hypothetical protein [Streptomyces sp. NPDC006691]|uniref:hypothetical protein n=1 Tax=Streptomyces sp. NPDC006691 TaxID=3364757 RepID=UPI00368B6676
MSGVSAVIATLVNPIAGALSDRVDRRNPFVLGGAVLTAVAIAALGSLDVLLLNAPTCRGPIPPCTGSSTGPAPPGPA